MAQRRMFSKKVTDTDAFLDMPLSAQCLYFHLNMEADDDGFLGNAKTIRRKIGASEDDLKLLITKSFLIPFENGVVVIKDWRIHNYIRRDTYNTTIYTDEKQQIEQDETGSYTIRQRDVDESSPQVRLGKDRIGKDRLEYIDADAPVPSPATKKVKEVKQKYGAFENVLLTDDEYSKLQEQFSDIDHRIERLSEYITSSGKSYKSHYATILIWARKDSETQPQQGAKQSYQRRRRVEKLPEWLQTPFTPAQQSQVEEQPTKSPEEIKARINQLFDKKE